MPSIFLQHQCKLLLRYFSCRFFQTIYWIINATFFALLGSTTNWTSIGCTSDIQIGANWTFYLECSKSKTIDWFGYCKYFGGAFSALNFNTSFFNTFLKCKVWLISSCFHLFICMQYGALLIIHPKDSKWMKELSTYFCNCNFKVGHEP